MIDIESGGIFSGSMNRGQRKRRIEDACKERLRGCQADAEKQPPQIPSVQQIFALFSFPALFVRRGERFKIGRRCGFFIDPFTQ